MAKRCIFEYGHQAWLKILIHQSTVVNDFSSFQLVHLIVNSIISAVITFNSCGGTRKTTTTSTSCFKISPLRIQIWYLDTLIRCKTRTTPQKSCEACARMSWWIAKIISACILAPANRAIFALLVNTTSQGDMHGLIKARLQKWQQGIYRWQ